MPTATVQEKFKAECSACQTIFKFSSEDLQYNPPGDGIACPVCHFWCRSYEKIKDFTESIRRIKQTVECFPGLVLGVDRQVGKTTAILEMIKDRYPGTAIYFGPNQYLCDFAEHAWRGTGFRLSPKFFSSSEQVRGYNLPIYVDEWWLLSQRQQDEVMQTGRVVCRLGTPRISH